MSIDVPFEDFSRGIFLRPVIGGGGKRVFSRLSSPRFYTPNNVKTKNNLNFGCKQLIYRYM